MLSKFLVGLIPMLPMKELLSLSACAKEECSLAKKDSSTGEFPLIRLGLLPKK